jgi:hypothetical protein
MQTQQLPFTRAADPLRRLGSDVIDSAGGQHTLGNVPSAVVHLQKKPAFVSRTRW